MRAIRRAVPALVLALALARVAGAAEADSVTAVQQIRNDAKAMAAWVRTPLAKRFLAAADGLPAIAPRTVLRDSSRTHAWTEAEAAALPDSARRVLVPRILDEQFYYNTRYGSPLAYARPLDLLAQVGLKDVTGRKVMDFGYGNIGQLRLLAALGAEAVGVDVDPMLRALYSAPGDQGAMGAHGGSVRILTGQFPADPELTRAAGEGYTLFLSKNTLKHGYIHPAETVDPRMLVHLGVDDSTFVHTLYRVLAPGGYAMIYNLCPAPAAPGKPYIPWSDGRSPFPESLWTAAGFRVLAFDRDDTAAAREMGHRLGWDQGESAMDLSKDLFGTYTLVLKPRH